MKNWADGKAADIGELQVVPDSYNAAYIAAGTGTGLGSSAAGGAAENAAAAGPFYQQLARHAQYLEVSGKKQ